ncbi:hypothetical protein ACFQ9R_31150 [Nocardia sp. NPDC056541]|uniref:hypothetical protein n=1 Tax=unclassified Nocardia TaxID=2637762 RepID=UPI0036524724
MSELQCDIQPAPPLRLTPVCTVYSGIVRLAMTGRFLQSHRAPADEFGAFVPHVAPLPGNEPEPQVWAEAYVMSTVSSAAGGFPAGVDYVRAAYLADPRGGTDRWLHLGGAAHIGKGLTLGYRITVQTTQG